MLNWFVRSWAAFFNIRFADVPCSIESRSLPATSKIQDGVEPMLPIDGDQHQDLFVCSHAGPTQRAAYNVRGGTLWASSFVTRHQRFRLGIVKGAFVMCAFPAVRFRGFLPRDLPAMPDWRASYDVPAF